MGVVVNTIQNTGASLPRCVDIGGDLNYENQLVQNSTHSLDLGSKTCPLVTELKDMTWGIAQGDFQKGAINAGFLAMALLPGASASSKMTTASKGAMIAQASAMSMAGQTAFNSSNT